MKQPTPLKSRMLIRLLFAENTRLRKAIKPFSDFGSIMLKTDKFDESGWTRLKDDVDISQPFTAGQFREAARAAKPFKKKAKEKK